DFHLVDTYSLLRGHRGYSVPDLHLPLSLGSHSSPGYFRDALWIIRINVQPVDSSESMGFSMFILNRVDNSSCIVRIEDDSDMSSFFYPFSTLLDGILC